MSSRPAIHDVNKTARLNLVPDPPLSNPGKRVRFPIHLRTLPKMARCGPVQSDGGIAIVAVRVHANFSH